MGGLDSGVTDGTTDILLESAFFTPSEIRRTSRRLFLTSDSSYRFERGVDPNQGHPSCRTRCRTHCSKLPGAKLSLSTATAGTVPSVTSPVELDVVRMDQLMDGTAFHFADAEAILTRLGLEKADGNVWNVPSWRADLERSADLVEEVARVHGLENVPTRTGGTAVDESQIDRDYDRLHEPQAEARSPSASSRYKPSSSFREAQLRDCLPLRPLMEGDLVKVSRPLSEDHAILRPSLTPGLIQTAERNLRQGAKISPLLRSRPTVPQCRRRQSNRPRSRLPRPPPRRRSRSSLMGQQRKPPH